VTRHELQELPKMLCYLSGRAQSRGLIATIQKEKIPTCVGISSTINFELDSKLGFTNKKSLPKGKPFIGEHRLDAST
jgi:hypothetical protein